MAFGNKEKQRHSTSGTPWVLCLTVSQGKSSRFSALLLMLSSLSYWLSSSSFLFPIWLEIPALAFVPRFPDFTSDTAGGSCGSPLVFFLLLFKSDYSLHSLEFAGSVLFPAPRFYMESLVVPGWRWTGLNMGTRARLGWDQTSLT